MTEDKYNEIMKTLKQLEAKINEVSEKVEQKNTNISSEEWPDKNAWYTSPNMTPSPADWWKGPVDQDLPDHICLHTQCPKCGGSGMTPEGAPCVHHIACFCPRCSIQC